MNNKKFGEDEGEVIDLRKEKEERRKKKVFGNLRIWIPNKMGYIHGSGQITHSIRPNSLKKPYQQKIAT